MAKPAFLQLELLQLNAPKTEYSTTAMGDREAHDHRRFPDICAGKGFGCQVYELNASVANRHRQSIHRVTAILDLSYYLPKKADTRKYRPLKISIIITAYAAFFSAFFPEIQVFTLRSRRLSGNAPPPKTVS